MRGARFEMEIEKAIFRARLFLPLGVLAGIAKNKRGGEKEENKVKYPIKFLRLRNGVNNCL